MAGRRRSPVIIATRIEIARPPDRVWPYLVDWERLGRWMREADRFRVLGERREGVGVEAEARVRIAGITTTDRIRVTRWERPTALELVHLGWVKGVGRQHLTATPGGTWLRWREELVPPWGLVGRLGLLLLRPVLRRAFTRDLENLRRLVESGR